MDYSRRGWIVFLSATCAAFALVALPVNALAAARYVAPSGNDTANDCAASASPCRTVGAAIDQALSGEVLKLAGGTYAEEILIETSTTLTIEGGYADGFASRDATEFPTVIAGDGFGEGVGLRARGGVALDITLDALAITKTSSCGIQALASDGGTIELTVRNVVSARNRCGLLAYNLTLNAYNVTVTIEDSMFRNNSDAGLNFIGTVDATIERSVAARNRLGGLVASFATGLIVVRNSIFYANSGSGFGAIRLANQATGSPPLAVTVVNSTIANSRVRTDLDNPEGAAVVVGDCRVSVTFQNSLIWRTRGSDLDVAVSSCDSSFSADHSSFGRTSGTYTDLGGNLSENPRLRPNGLLRPTSTMIDAADCALAPVMDIDGDARPTGAGCDIGADEFVP